MELYYMISILDRDRSGKLLKLHEELHISVILDSIGKGTAMSSHLSLYDLEQKEKSVICAIASEHSMRQLIRGAVNKLYFDIPGNGVMMAVPIKSISGGKNLKHFTAGQQITGGAVPDMNFENELIIVILNEGHSDEVMDVARDAGATGGTVLHAKGTAGPAEKKFFRVSLAEEKDIVYILTSSKKKSDIMKRISAACGSGSPVGAVCFSLPVSEVIGIRKATEE